MVPKTIISEVTNNKADKLNLMDLLFFEANNETIERIIPIKPPK
jgi:hypothetical protein